MTKPKNGYFYWVVTKLPYAILAYASGDKCYESPKKEITSHAFE